MRIIFEDAELEEFAMEGDGEIAVPVQVSKDNDGTVITVYSRFEKEAGEFSRFFARDPFSSDAISFLRRRVEPAMNDAGYEYEWEYDHTVLKYEAVSEDGIRTMQISDAEVVFIETEDELSKYYFATTRDFTINDDDKNDVAFAAVRDGAALSVASVNDLSEDGAIEVNVETVPAERGKGYASAVCASLCKYLLSRGERVVYQCRASNGASRAVAEKCGLKYKGKTFSFVCYRNL
ncbi:MAG: GNAT family N-acetyltransferase [Clostridia bacterium]|nr:GNAT family N-acetyltransferase [Clostridia bacterium]